MATPVATGDNDNNENGRSDLPDPKLLWSCYEAIAAADQRKNELIKDTIASYDQVMQTALKYDEELENYRTTLETAHEWRDHAVYLQDLLNQNPFVAILIDGSSLLFHPSFLSQGAIGGEHAATLLQTAVTERVVPTLIDCPSDVKIVARVYLDLKSLADRCAKAGITTVPGQLVQFMYGFMQAKVLFDIIDVGPSKDRVTSRVVENFKLFIGDFHCRQVVLGCDGGPSYQPLLEYCTKNIKARSRLTLIEGAGPERAELQSVAFPGIFHVNDQAGQIGSIHGRSDSRATLNGASEAFTPAGSLTSASPYTPLGNTGASGTRFGNDHGTLPGLIPKPATTWAAVTTKNAHKPLTVAAPPRAGTAFELPVIPASPKDILRNKRGQRLDPHMNYDREDVQRIKKLKSCNQHYIGVGCCHYNAGKADKCPHNHEYHFTSSDLRTLRVVARETPCKSGHDCDNPKCIYGHQCPFPVPTEGSMRGTGCMNGEACRFPRSMHDMDLVPAKMTKVVGTF